MTTVVTADIIGSRALADRAAVQRTIEDAMARVDRDLPLARSAFRATVGDEFQAVYDTLTDALAAILLIRLVLPDGAECRFGVGVGETYPIPTGTGELPEGPGWWAAREAIDALHAQQVRAMPAVRTWIRAADDEDATVHEAVRMANAYAWARDELVGGMSERARRLIYGRCLGRAQRELAAAEGISQSAVSQQLAVAGAAGVVAGFQQLRG